MIHAFLHQKGIHPEAYESSLCLLEENSLQGVILHENSSWESQLFRKNIINVKLAAANSTGQLKRLFQEFYAARRADGTDFIFIKIPAEDIGAMQVVQQLPNAYFVGSLLKLVSPVRVYNSTPPFEITEAALRRHGSDQPAYPRRLYKKQVLSGYPISVIKVQTACLKSGRGITRKEELRYNSSPNIRERPRALFRGCLKAMNSSLI